MARIPSSNPITIELQTPNNNGRGSFTTNTTTNSDRDRYELGSLASRVYNSVAYQQAYAILSKESDSTWLARLTAIPTSVDDANSTWFDEQGWINNYEDKQDANYQYCMEQISALMQEYHTWKNSLPTTQVQQLSDAGINSAITGQGVSSSSIPNVGVTSNPSSIQSANSIEVLGSALSTAVDFIMNPVNGFADLAFKFKQLRQSDRTQIFNEQSALLDFYKYASENGYALDRNFLANSFRDLFSSDEVLFTNPKGERLHADELLKKYLTHHKNAPLVAGLATLYPDIMPRLNLSGYDEVSTGILSTPVGLTEVVRSQLELHRNEELYRLKRAKFDSISAQYDSETSEHQSAKAKFDKETADYVARKHKITNTLIDKLANSTHEDDVLLLSKILLGYNYDDIDILNAQADFIETEKSLEAFSTVADALSNDN